MQPHTSYLVCGTPRSGSSLLCEALTNTGIAGQPEEYFQPSNEVLWQERWGTSTYAEYLARTIEHCTSSNGVCGVKMMWGYFDHFLRHARQMPDYKEQELPACTLLQALFPNLRYIWIKRRDTVRQAVSHARAMQTNQWVVRAENTTVPARTPEFSFMQIDYMAQEIAAHDAAWQRFFTENGIQPLVIMYEESVSEYEETVRKVLSHLDIPDAERVTISPVSMKKQADAQSEAWVLRYLQLKQQARRYRFLSYVNKYLLSFPLSTRTRSWVMNRRG